MDYLLDRYKFIYLPVMYLGVLWFYSLPMTNGTYNTVKLTIKIFPLGEGGFLFFHLLLVIGVTISVLQHTTLANQGRKNKGVFYKTFYFFYFAWFTFFLVMTFNVGYVRNLETIENSLSIFLFFLIFLFFPGSVAFLFQDPMIDYSNDILTKVEELEETDSVSSHWKDKQWREDELKENPDVYQNPDFLRKEYQNNRYKDFKWEGRFASFFFR